MLYATSDLHGCNPQTLNALLNKAIFSNRDTLFVLGDVIDRGEHGIELLDMMLDRQNIELILGNHEAMMLSCGFLFEEITSVSIERLKADDIDMYLNWISNGGQPTIDALKALDREDAACIFEYVKKAPLYKKVTAGGRDFLLTHSGIGSFDKAKPLSDYTAEDFLWNRPDISDRYFDDIITVFGHTPTHRYGAEYKGRALFTDTWIDIDAGTAGGMNPMLLRLDDSEEIYL